MSFLFVCWSSTTSFLILLTALAMAVIFAITPVSPFARNFSSSSCMYRICFSCVSSLNFFFAVVAFLLFSIAATFIFSALSASKRFNSSSPEISSEPEEEEVSAFALPNPERRARPMCACFKAPTSFPPSPHINTNRLCSFIFLTICSFPSGAIRAKIQISLILSHVFESTSTASRKEEPVTTKDFVRASSLIFSASKGILSASSSSSLISTHSS
mmetsp:Transcript_12981/g.17582  ORF Transcript_12981/g.17582 Transcript_12981/m.17582 type:complete len:215 (-) Transcript_12981:1289-1933(-)